MKEIKLRDFQMRPYEVLQELPVKLMAKGRAIAVIKEIDKVDKNRITEIEEQVTELQQKVNKIEKYIDLAKSRGY